MKVFKYPELVSNNFGITVDGELYSGVLSQSGKKHPLAKSSNVRDLNGHEVARRNTSSKGFSNLTVDVNGVSVYRQQFAQPAGAQYVNFDKSKNLRGGAALKPFTSELGVTKGKSYFPTGTGRILDENGEEVFNVLSSNYNAVNFLDTQFLRRDVDNYAGAASILFETETRLYALIQSNIGGYDHIVWTNKIRVAETAPEGNFFFGSFDVEYLGRDPQNRVLLAFHIDNYAQYTNEGVNGINPELKAPGMGFILRQRNAENVFEKVADYTWGSSGYYAGDSNYSYMQTSLCEPAKEFDENGRLLSIGFLTYPMGNANQTNESVAPYLTWTKITFSETPTKVDTRIDLPEFVGESLRRPVTSSGYFGVVVQCTQFIDNGKVYAVFSNGSFARLRENSNVTVPAIPVTIMELPLSGTDVTLPASFHHVEQNVFLDLYHAVVDPKSRRVWWLSDTLFGGSNFHVRCLDIDSRSLDHAYLGEAFLSAGAQDGKLLLITVPNNPETYKYVLEPESKQVNIKLGFDKTVYVKGESGKLSVHTNSPRDLNVEVRLDNCTFLDGSKNKQITFSALTPQTIDVTVQATPSATVTRAEYVEEPVV